MLRFAPGAMALALLSPAAALACGGLFCSGLNPIPVEQSGERILFEVDLDAGVVTTTVDIQYEGAPDAFSWLLPVPVSAAMPVPELALAPEALLLNLELATQPTIIPPPTRCTQRPRDPSVNSGSLRVLNGLDEPTGVQVTDLPNVGPYDSELIQARTGDALLDWLRTNRYLVGPAMEPALADYVGEGLAFVGVKLLPEAGTSR